MTVSASAASTEPSIRLACVVLSRFRRLAGVRLDLDKSTTILVGANNSGKTSVLLALRHFLSEVPAFRAFDISLSHWKKLRAIGGSWEALTENPSTAPTEGDKWGVQLQELLECMPTLDLWFDAQGGAYNYVVPLITSLKWDGGAVGVRLRLEPASTVEDLQQLAWRYREARAPVRELEKKGHAWPTDLLDFWLREVGDLRKIVAYRLDPAKGPLSVGAD